VPLVALSPLVEIQRVFSREDWDGPAGIWRQPEHGSESAAEFAAATQAVVAGAQPVTEYGGPTMCQYLPLVELWRPQAKLRPP